MRTRRLIWVLLPLLFLGCENDTTTVVPPPALTPDEQVVANCRALRDEIETYAAANGGSYGLYLHFNPRVNPYTGEDEPSRQIGGSAGQIALEAYQNCDGEVLGYRVTGFGKDRVLVTLEDVSDVPQDIRYMHDVTIANVRLVFDATKRYAAENNGEFPADVGGTPNLEGKTLVDYLPNGTHLLNPFNSIQENPVDGAAAAAGHIGYTPMDPVGDGTFAACMIDANGCSGSTILVVLPYSVKEEHVFHDALWLRVAVNAFKQASGRYPLNLNTETTPGGKTVLDLYFENEHDFENPYTGETYVPSLGLSTKKGEVAYQPVETAGVVTGFIITGWGAVNEILRLGPTLP